MIRAHITLNVVPSRRDETLAGLLSLMGSTRAEPGCIECNLMSDAEDGCRIYLIEEWATEEQLRRRLRSKSYRSLLEILESATVVPRVQFDTVESRRGIEVVHEERAGVR